MNRNLRIVSMACTAAAAAALTACATQDPYYGAQNFPEQQASPRAAYANGAPAPYATYPTQPAGYVEYGRITNVALVHQGSRPGNSQAGAALGAVAGGLLGNQIGHGSGRAAATILGALGGAAVGNNIAGGNNAGAYANTAGPVYRVSVQTDAGQLRTYDVSATGDLRPGDRVRIENGVIYLS
jgi:outer membrane lipoprotein SlyB